MKQNVLFFNRHNMWVSIMDMLIEGYGINLDWLQSLKHFFINVSYLIYL